MAGRGEDHGARHQGLGRGSGKIFGAGRLLGDGDVAGRLHERGELFVRHFGGVHPEAVDEDAMHGTRIGRGLHPDDVAHVRRVLRPHRELPARNPHHAVGRGRRRRDAVFECRKKSTWTSASVVAGSGLVAGLERIAVTARTIAPAIAATAAQVHALRGGETAVGP